jgi:hypothetical protein
VNSALQLRIYSVPKVTSDFEILSLVTDAAGGSTSSITQGTWKHGKEIVSERSSVLEAIVFGNTKELRPKIKELLGRINARAKVLGEKAILASLTPIDAELVEMNDGE